jgi:hypothetical protein
MPIEGGQNQKITAPPPKKKETVIANIAVI